MKVSAERVAARYMANTVDPDLARQVISEMGRLRRDLDKADPYVRIETYLGRYRYVMQQLNQIGVLTDALRRKINRHNKTIGGLQSRFEDDIAKMQAGYQLIADELKKLVQ